ncbi:hypothetical protein NEPAR04_1046 [Nematocida parisii]|nr:hypothetical protein NEPAR03_1054 [Nematocida parisii]KAI5128915.1 hypothetical protein NEPAR08_1402 [Nematocida parisii]KAI5141556.1 hypothetical protein NEPAR04_1046 [Nematocida parisii]
MEKRRADVPPLKKIAYDASVVGEGNWWDEEQTTTILQKKIDAIFAQIEEYKRVAEHAESEKLRIERVKVDELLSLLENVHPDKVNSEMPEIIKKEILNCQQHMQTISQLRKRASQAKEVTVQPQPEATPAIDASEISEHINRIDSLESKVLHMASRLPPNYTKLVKALEQENKDLSLSIKVLTEKIEEFIKKDAESYREKEKAEKRIEEIFQASSKKESELLAEKERICTEKDILQKRVNELYLALETLNSTIVEQTRDLENVSENRVECANQCHIRIKELENKEIDRLEEVAFLVRKYIDTGKKNDLLLEEITELKHQIKHSAPQMISIPEESNNHKEIIKSLQEELHQLKVDVERGKMDYLERKSSANYHKRKSVQHEAELSAARKAASDLAEVNKHLQSRLHESEKSKKLSSQRDIELYQGMIRCSLCSTNIKNVALKRCMHLMCRACIDERMASRQKTCPLCGTTCTPNDIVSVYL